jgi:hypothetical protein
MQIVNMLWLDVDREAHDRQSRLHLPPSFLGNNMHSIMLSSYRHNSGARARDFFTGVGCVRPQKRQHLFL